MNKLALITGASTGIGRELSRIHAEKGGDLVIVARSGDKLEELKSELEGQYGIKVYVIVKDLGEKSAPQEIYNELKGKALRIDYLINNAGFGGIGKFHERDWDLDLAMIHLNIIALSTMTRLFLPDFVERNSGRILNVSSTASLVPGPNQAVYYASKAYVTSFTNALAEELYDKNITVTNLMPGPTISEFGRVSGMDKTSFFKGAASSRTIADQGYQGMMSGKLDVLAGSGPGQKFIFALMRFLPKKMVMPIIRKGQEVS